MMILRIWERSVDVEGEVEGAKVGVVSAWAGSGEEGRGIGGRKGRVRGEEGREERGTIFRYRSRGFQCGQCGFVD
jgi:hypothetical protein